MIIPGEIVFVKNQLKIKQHHRAAFCSVSSFLSLTWKIVIKMPQLLHHQPFQQLH